MYVVETSVDAPLLLVVATVAIIIVGPELILSFNGTYRARTPFAFAGDLLLSCLGPRTPTAGRDQTRFHYRH